MNDPESHDHDLLKILHTETEFEAHARAAVLHEEGIDARVIRDGATWSGMLRISATEGGAGVWIRQEDEMAALAALEQNVADSVDLDWDEVDVGTPIDDENYTSRQGMPVPARIAFMVAVLMLLMGLALAITMFLP